MLAIAAGTVPAEDDPLPDDGSATPVMSLSTEDSDVSSFTVPPSTATTYSSLGCGFELAATYNGRMYTMEFAIGTMSVSPSSTCEPCWFSRVISDDTALSAWISASALAGPRVPWG